MTILFAGGGTGGHLFPAIAVAEEIKKKDPSVRIAFVGTKAKIEARVVPNKGFEFYTLWISGFSRRFRLSNILFPVKVAVSLVQSFFLIRKLKPNVVVGTGGYVCGPILYVASQLDVPTVVHESNSYPGVTTRMLASRVTKVFTSFEVTARWLPGNAAVELIGNPTREELSRADRNEGCGHFGLDPSKLTVFVFGGSLGAASINSVMPDIIRDASANGYQVIWQTGETDAQPAARSERREGIAVMKFVERMDLGYAAADLVVSRSGATTLAELTRLGKPAILVPYPYAAANHQELNARTLADAGAARIVLDAELKEKLLPAVASLMKDRPARETMSRNSLRLGRPDAGKKIAEKIMGMAR